MFIGVKASARKNRGSMVRYLPGEIFRNRIISRVYKHLRLECDAFTRFVKFGISSCFYNELRCILGYLCLLILKGLGTLSTFNESRLSSTKQMDNGTVIYLADYKLVIHKCP